MKEYKECVYIAYMLEKLMKETEQEDVKVILAEAVRQICVKESELFEKL